MGQVYKTSDGWDLDNILPLEQMIDSYGNMEGLVYELRNCVRTMSLVEMRDRLLEVVNEMKEYLKDIDDDDIVVEEDEV